MLERRGNLSELDKAELQRLQLAVAQAEELFAKGISSVALTTFLNAGQQRLSTLQAEGSLEGESESKRKEKLLNLEAGIIVAREHRLSAAEKYAFADLLTYSHFKREHFVEIEAFYAQSWDKLSENGKAQLSHRVWEGIRQDEYSFTELPKIIQKKESEKIFESLTEGQSLLGIPEKDREDFVREYQSGRHEEAARILERPSFKESVSRSPEPEIATEIIAKSESAVISTREPDQTPKTDFNNIDFENLPDLKDVSEPTQPHLAEPKSTEKQGLTL